MSQGPQICQAFFSFSPDDPVSLPSSLALVGFLIRMEGHKKGLRFPYFVQTCSIWVVHKCFWLKMSVCFSRIIGILSFSSLVPNVGRNQDNSAFWKSALGSCCLWGAWKPNDRRSQEEKWLRLTLRGSVDHSVLVFPAVWGELVIVVTKVTASKLPKIKYPGFPMIKCVHPSLFIHLSQMLYK